MITEGILTKFRNKIINEELHLPHGTKSAKVITHVDLDGVTSGITMVQQLIKQGIPKERITVEFANYGDDDKEKDLSHQTSMSMSRSTFDNNNIEINKKGVKK